AFVAGHARADDLDAFVATPMPSWMQWVHLVPGASYNPANSNIPRRRPGHPPVIIQEDREINPGAVNPAPVDAVGAFVPLPDRWRIMEALGFKFPWYDPYNQNIWKGDKPMKIPGLKGDDWFFSL